MPDDAVVSLLANGSTWLIATLLVFIFIAVLRMFSYLNQLQNLVLQQKAEEAGVPAELAPERESWWTGFYARMTDAVPVEDEEAIMTDHNYDGIIELDNNLPPWWKAGFYLGIVFAVIYLMRWHIFQTEPLSAQEYAIEMEEAEEEEEADGTDIFLPPVSLRGLAKVIPTGLLLHGIFPRSFVGLIVKFCILFSVIFSTPLMA